jgi:membrane-associated HD superfamily phosphohydrolase
MNSILNNEKVKKVSRVILANLNVSKVVCNHLISESHSHTHRMIAGIFIMSVGVSISKIHVAFVVVHFLLDGVGYAIHGIGLIPFVEALSKHAGESVKEETKDENKPD